MAASTDLGNATVREILKNKIGAEAADRVLNEVNDAFQKGKRGDELKKHFKDTMAKEGHDISQEHSGVLYGFFIP